MFAVTGITGQVGGATARTLLDTGLSVRAVMRDAAKGAAWRESGCEIALADMKDAAALTDALSGVDGIFVIMPPIFDPTPGFPEARAIITAVTKAIGVAKPSKVVCLSTIGAQATQLNLLNQLGLLEQALGAVQSPGSWKMRPGTSPRRATRVSCRASCSHSTSPCQWSRQPTSAT